MNNISNDYNISNEKLKIKSANAILQCAATRSIRRYNGHWNPVFSDTFEECKNEYHKYLNKSLENYKYSDNL